MRNAKPRLHALPLLTVLALLLQACAQPPAQPPMHSCPKPPRAPALPSEARQLPAPAWCSQTASRTCSEAAELELQSWRSSLTTPAPAAWPASAPTPK